MEETSHKLVESCQGGYVLLSFLLPVYNVKDYLEDCIQSIVQQDLEGIEYEIICIDDNSTDGSYEYLLELAKKKQGITILKNAENKGVSYTRNRLIREAKGKYVWFVDPDDMVFKNAAKSFLYKAEEVNADILLGNYIRVEETTKGNADYVTNWDMIGTNPEQKKQYLPIDQHGKMMCSVCPGLFLRSFLLENNLWMNEKMIAQEDTLFYYEFSLKTKNVYKWEVPCYLYRQRKSSVMNTHNEERNKKYYISMREMLKVYIKHLENGDYTDLNVLERKIHHSKQNVVTCLAMIHDKKYIKSQLKLLRKEKSYPYKFRKEVFKSSDSFLRKVLIYLLPIKPFFWLYHFLYTVYDKNRR